ncbi:MAG: alcohol dehydrogenase catalytic domain-containing protein [Myxococcota bacterium]
MKAVRCQNGRVLVQEVARPEGPGVRVQIASAGICGSDLHLVAGAFPMAHTLGHEFAGTLADGTAVAIEPIAPCGECIPCQRDDYHLCTLGPSMIFGMARDGGMAEEVLVPEATLVRLAPGLAARDACLVEPLAVAIHGLRQAGVGPDTRVAIVGAGSIGLSAVAATVAMGARPRLLARHDFQRAAGERLGADIAENDDADCDVVVDAAGSSSALEAAVNLSRPGGLLLLLGTYWDGFDAPIFPICLREIRILPSSMYNRGPAGRDVEVAARMLAENPEIARTLISHRLPLEAAAEAFELARDRTRGAIKVVLEPGAAAAS